MIKVRIYMDNILYQTKFEGAIIEFYGREWNLFFRELNEILNNER